MGHLELGLDKEGRVEVLQLSPLAPDGLEGGERKGRGRAAEMRGRHTPQHLEGVKRVKDGRYREGSGCGEGSWGRHLSRRCGQGGVVLGPEQLGPGS